MYRKFLDLFKPISIRNLSFDEIEKKTSNGDYDNKSLEFRNDVLNLCEMNDKKGRGVFRSAIMWFEGEKHIILEFMVDVSSNTKLFR